ARRRDAPHVTEPEDADPHGFPRLKSVLDRAEDVRDLPRLHRYVGDVCWNVTYVSGSGQISPSSVPGASPAPPPAAPDSASPRPGTPRSRRSWPAACTRPRPCRGRSGPPRARARRRPAHAAASTRVTAGRTPGRTPGTTSAAPAPHGA